MNSSIITDRHNHSVHDYLYKKGSAKNSPKDSIEIEYEKQKEECTFKPNTKQHENKKPKYTKKQNNTTVCEKKEVKL